MSGEETLIGRFSQIITEAKKDYYIHDADLTLQENADFEKHIIPTAVFLSLAVGADLDGDQLIDRFNNGSNPLSPEEIQLLSSSDHQPGVSFADVATFCARHNLIQTDKTSEEIQEFFSPQHVVNKFLERVKAGNSPSATISEIANNLERGEMHGHTYIFKPALEQLQQVTSKSKWSEPQKALYTFAWKLLSLEYEYFNTRSDYKQRDPEYTYPVVRQMLAELKPELDALNKNGLWDSEYRQVFDYFIKDFTGGAMEPLGTDLYLFAQEKDKKIKSVSSTDLPVTLYQLGSKSVLVNQGVPPSTREQFRNQVEILKASSSDLRTLDWQISIKDLEQNGLTAVKPVNPDGPKSKLQWYVCYDYAFGVSEKEIGIDANGYPVSFGPSKKDYSLYSDAIRDGYEFVDLSQPGESIKNGDILLYGDIYVGEDPSFRIFSIPLDESGYYLDIKHAAYVLNGERVMQDGLISKMGHLPLYQHGMYQVDQDLGRLIVVLRKKTE